MVESLDIPGLAARWNVSERTVWARASRGEIPCLRIGARYVFPVAVIAEWERTEALASLRPVPEPSAVPVRRGRRRGGVVEPVGTASAAPPARRTRPVRPDEVAS